MEFLVHQFSYAHNPYLTGERFAIHLIRRILRSYDNCKQKKKLTIIIIKASQKIFIKYIVKVYINIFTASRE